MTDNRKILTLGSLFDGSGGFPLGGVLAGIRPVWASEIEPFPIRVTTKRFPEMTHYGDVSKLDGGKLPPVDIITFGSPCQDMSIAGKRAGLDGSRSNLFYQSVRIVKEMRCATDGKYPRFIVWENVPGAFSSNGGADFQAVLSEICAVKDCALSAPRPAKWPDAGAILADGFSLAWRVLDAQFWGVPQRRKRIYLVCDFDGGRAGEILFESEGVSRYTPQGFRAWQGAPGSAGNGSAAAGGLCVSGCYAGAFHINQRNEGIDLHDVSGALMATRTDQMQTFVAERKSAGFYTEHSKDSRSIGYEEEKSPTLRAGTVPAAVYENHSQDTRYTGPVDVAPTVSAKYGTGGNNQPFVVGDAAPVTLKIRSGCEGGGKGSLIQNDLSATLGCNNDQTLFQPKAYGISSHTSFAMQSDNPNSGIYEAETSRTLDCGGGKPTCNQGGMAIVDKPPVYAMTTGAYTQVSEEKAPTVLARDYKDPAVVNEPAYAVRRLTPVECARLQGFPDWWCDGLETENPTDEELAFWRDVWETHRKITGTSSKPKSEKQLRKWLANPRSDAAEYRMWGNGVALPCVFYVMAGIAWAAETETGAN